MARNLCLNHLQRYRARWQVWRARGRADGRLQKTELSLTGALFRLEKTNARVPDPNNPGFNILDGAQRVDGFDISAVGRLTDD